VGGVGRKNLMRRGWMTALVTVTVCEGIVREDYRQGPALLQGVYITLQYITLHMRGEAPMAVIEQSRRSVSHSVSPRCVGA